MGLFQTNARTELVELNPEPFHDLQHFRPCTDLVLGVALIKGYIDDKFYPQSTIPLQSYAIHEIKTALLWILNKTNMLLITKDGFR